MTITTINCFSVKLTNYVQVFFTFAKIAIIAAIVVSGMVLLCRGETENLQNAFSGNSPSVSAVALAFYSGLFSYDGW